MSTSFIRTRFAAIYEGLPDSARREFLEDQLLPLIDGLSSRAKMEILSAAERAHSQYLDMPHLDLASKRAEVDALFDELKRDATRGPNNSQRVEITEEIVNSLVSWLSEIWQVVYEYGVDFEKAHECLLFCSKALHQIGTTGSGCKCGFAETYVPVAIKDRRGKIIKHFSYSGAHLLEDAFLWIWRDMLLKILAHGKRSDTERIPQMLEDIQKANKGWLSLDRILIAGGQLPPKDDFDTDYEEEDDDDDDIHCYSHAVHWSPNLLAQLPALRTHISTSLFAMFKLTPSLPLYTSIISLEPTIITPLLAHLRTAITCNPVAAATALDIHSLNGDAHSIAEVLDSARTVLRPRDAPSMQHAVHFLSHSNPYVSTALEIVARELRDSVAVMRGLIASASFDGVDKPESRAELDEVLKLRFNTAQRQEHVEHWVNSVVTGPPSSGNPLTFAAFLMGFPPGFEPVDTEEPDPFLFAGIKESDPEYEDLREEWRPRLKDRFEGWVREADLLPLGGQELLVQVANIIGEIMPYTRGSDIVDEMITRIQDQPTKYHICDALEALSVFMKSQRKKLLAERSKVLERRKRDKANASTGKQTGDTKQNNKWTPGSSPVDTEGAGPSTEPCPMPGLEALD